jgi:hypothetical protein
MKFTPKDFLGSAIGTVVLLAIILLAMHFSQEENPAAKLAFKARRVDLVNQMRAGLASASEAEKSAVLAITDKDSETYAGQARTATAAVEQQRQELSGLLDSGGTANEKELLAGFSKAFADFQQIDKELLALAVKGTNLKAYNLAFGPAADALAEMDGAISRLVYGSAGSPDARQVAVLAFGAGTAALRLQALLAPHIAEESDQKMDALEARMTQDDQTVRKNLASLAALPQTKENADLAAATASYARFSDIRKQILALSRENTNVRSLSISLNQKRKAMLVCEDELTALQQAILAEPIPGVTYGTPALPR